ncbi:MAG: hypothetical protein WDN23_01685 [Edaphobacter sp.]
MLSVTRSLLLSLSLSVAAVTTAATAQDPVVAFPKNYSIALDNSAVTVIRVHYGPHEHVGVHDHSAFSTIYVYLSDSGPVHFTHDENPPFEVTRPPAVKGNFRVSPGRKERHSVDNLGDKSSDFLRVELKQLPLDGSGLEEFRGKAPTGPLHSGDTVEFHSTSFDIERIICEAPAPCTIKASDTPSLLIALSPVTMTDASHHAVPIDDGGIKWLQGSQPVSVASASAVPAHLLRVVLKSPQSKPAQ